MNTTDLLTRHTTRATFGHSVLITLEELLLNMWRNAPRHFLLLVVHRLFHDIDDLLENDSGFLHACLGLGLDPVLEPGRGSVLDLFQELGDGSRHRLAKGSEEICFEDFGPGGCDVPGHGRDEFDVKISAESSVTTKGWTRARVSTEVTAWSWSNGGHTGTVGCPMHTRSE